MIDQSATYKMYLKASRHWDVFTVSTTENIPASYFSATGEQKDPQKAVQYIHFNISQAWFLWGILSRGLPSVSGTTKMDASPLRDFAYKCRDVKYYMDFWLQSQFIR